MPTSSVIRAAFFALGAAVGGGAVVALNASKKQGAATVPSPTADPASSVGPRTTRPIIEFGAIGDPHFSQAVEAGYPVLKYGNPGSHSSPFFAL